MVIKLKKLKDVLHKHANIVSITGGMVLLIECLSIIAAAIFGWHISAAHWLLYSGILVATMFIIGWYEDVQYEEDIDMDGR